MKKRSVGQYLSVLLAVLVGAGAVALAVGMVHYSGTVHGWNLAAAAYSAVVLAFLGGLCARASAQFWRG